jgi:hypothetical protein
MISQLELHFQRETKIVIFRKGGRICDYDFTYGVLSAYTYLWVPFSSHCVFANHLKNKGIKAVWAVWTILTRGKANSLETKLKPFDTIVHLCNLTLISCLGFEIPGYYRATAALFPSKASRSEQCCP